MRNIFLILLTVCISGALSAQSDSVLTSKKGIAILPVAGDFGLGMSADPFLEYIGNFFNGNTNNNLSVGSPTIHAKYYLDNKTALKASLRISKSNDHYNYYVRDDAAFFADPTSEAQVIDERYTHNTTFNLGLAYVKYRGYGRLQGFYGAQVGYYYNRSYDEYFFGNPITEFNTDPSANWNWGSYRETLNDDGVSQTVSVGFIAGIEYFFLPKISIGGDLFLGYSHTWQSQDEIETEEWNNGQVIKNVMPSSPGNVYSDIYTYTFDVFGSLSVMFHF